VFVHVKVSTWIVLKRSEPVRRQILEITAEQVHAQLIFNNLFRSLKQIKATCCRHYAMKGGMPKYLPFSGETRHNFNYSKAGGDGKGGRMRNPILRERSRRQI
jgi:hypothetical protein